MLVPGGTFLMGVQKNHRCAPNCDPDVDLYEPLHRATVGPFLISKCEMTQGQWRRLTGRSPAVPTAPSLPCLGTIHDRHPVYGQSWTAANRELHRYNLAVPTMGEGEYVARAGTTTQWWTGSELTSLRRAANLADQTHETLAGRKKVVTRVPWDDHYVHTAPADSLRPNAFGLHEVAGNVWKWCSDGRRLPRPSRALEGYVFPRECPRHGGGWDDPATFASIGHVNWNLPDYSCSGQGFRPVLPIRPR